MLIIAHYRSFLPAEHVNGGSYGYTSERQAEATAQREDELRTMLEDRLEALGRQLQHQLQLQRRPASNEGACVL